MRPRLLDLFCCAGGAAMGYHRAGFDVVGVDIKPQPNYPFDFMQGDALVAFEMPAWIETFDAIHASPPCQLHSTLKTGITNDYQDLVTETREAIRATGLPYVIENVVGSPLVDTIMLCGSSFDCVDGDAELRRHRIFETNWTVWAPPACNHQRQVLGVYGDLANEDRCNNPNRPGHGWKAGKARARRLMGIDWPITDRELGEAIPPAYTEFIGHQLINHLKGTT